jgi:alkylation response protein AidB-like acyl-CoA dehydrogenase
MDFTFSEEQEDLRAAVRAFLSDHAGRDYLARMADDERGFTDEMWQRLVEMGWHAVLVPEEQDGLGLGLVDMTVVMEEMGRVTFPGPYFSSAVLATLAARRLDATDLLGQLASGDVRGTAALEEFGHGDPVDRVRTRVRRKAADWVLTGHKPLVLDAHTADWAIVAARTEIGIGSFLVEAPRAEPVPVIDPTRKMASLVLDETPAIPIGPDGDHTAIWRRVVDDAAVMLVAELVGSSEAAHELAVEYSKQRIAFGRPLATFQALRHKMVDMLHHVELARVGAHYAAWTSDVDDPERERAAAMCKGYVGEAAVMVSSEDIQIHGGVGFTWDCLAHYHYKRAKVNDMLLGSQAYQRRRVASLVLDSA